MLAAGGVFVPQDMGGGISAVDDLTLSSSFAGSYGGMIQAAPQAGGDSGIAQPRTSYLWVFAAIFVLLVALKYASEHEKLKGQLSLGGVGVFSLIAVTLMSVLGIVALKTVVNKWPAFPALTNFVNAV